MNRIKSLLPSLLLIAAYFVADMCFGTLVGACTALVLGCAEFIYTRIREKVCDRMILWTTLLFCLPGVLCLFPENPWLTRLQPVVVEASLCLLIGMTAFSKLDPTATLPAGMRRQFRISPDQLRGMRQTLRLLFALLATHTLLACAAFFLSEKTAAFIGGTLLYLLLALFFAALIVRNRLQMRKFRREEWLPVVNEKGEVTGKAPRSVCHSGSKLLHPVVHLHILNDRRAVFLQKRSLKKDLLPGIWDTAVGGHVGLNEKIEDALRREAAEELGITRFEARFLGSYVWESPRERELVFSFLCTRYDRIRIDNDEVDEGRFWSAEEIREGIRQNLLTPNFVHEYNTLLAGKTSPKN